MKIITIIGMTFLMSSNTCSSEYINDSRIFVEGKITSFNKDIGNIRVKLVNQDILISNGETKNDGAFAWVDLEQLIRLVWCLIKK